MYIFIENDKAYLMHDEIEINHFVNGNIFYNDKYPIGAMVPIYTKKPGKMELLGNPCEHETAIKIKDLVDMGIEIR